MLFYRLAERRLGAEGARRAVLYLALFPMALFLQAVYSESLYLLLSHRSIPARRAPALPARRRRHRACAADETRRRSRSCPRSRCIAWRSPNRRQRCSALPSRPLMFAAYPLLLWTRRGDPWEFLHAQGIWTRQLSPLGPLGGVWDGLRAGWAGVRQLASGSSAHSYWPAVEGTDPMRVAAVNLECLAFLVLFVVLAVIAWRRFGAPYGLFAAISLAIPLSYAGERWPLLSIPRFGLSIFPLFLALAAIGGRPRAHVAILSVSSLFLGVAVVQWSLWQWVA